VSQVSQVS